MSQAFTRDRRLLSAADYRRVFDKPRKSADAFFTVLARTGPSQPGLSRLGLAIAKKQLRRAVDRNRIKRLAREVFRQQVAGDVAMDFVVLTRASVRHRSNAELAVSLQQHFQKLIAQA